MIHDSDKKPHGAVECAQVTYLDGWCDLWYELCCCFCFVVYMFGNKVFIVNGGKILTLFIGTLL